MSKLVEIACYHSLPEAAVAQSCLEAHGHAVVAMEYYHATMAWHHLGAIGGVRLAAPEAEVQQARHFSRLSLRTMASGLWAKLKGRDRLRAY